LETQAGRESAGRDDKYKERRGDLVSDKSKIEWTNATWNPVTGCTKVSEGCRNCYAMTFAERFRGTPGHYFENGFDITPRHDKLDQPLRWQRPRKIFVNSMSDLFHPEVPFDFIDQVFAVMALAPQHTFQILTKRPERMLEYFAVDEKRWDKLADIAPYMEAHGWISPEDAANIAPPGSTLPKWPSWPLPNVWLGVSVENQKAADERIPLLLQTPAAVRFLSMEPLLGPVDLKNIEHGFLNFDVVNGSFGGPDDSSQWTGSDKIDWVIVGGESGRNARPMHPDWVRDIRDQCQASGVAFFFKQHGEWAQVHDLRDNEPAIKGKKWFTFDPDTSVCRIGKEAAGRMLDGRTWSEFPGVGK
jgi:protein gp37